MLVNTLERVSWPLQASTTLWRSASLLIHFNGGPHEYTTEGAKLQLDHTMTSLIYMVLIS